jgi:hypothetical protein
MLLCGCGDILGFGDDDEHPAPDVPADAGSADAASDGDARGDADAQPLFWSCTTDPPSPPFPTEDACNSERLRQICTATGEPPIGVQCDTFGGDDVYCQDTCQKSAPGASTYVFTNTHCTCAR